MTDQYKEASELSSKIDKIIKAAEFIENGDPYKDVLDEFEVMEIIVELANRLKKESRGVQ